MVHSELLDSHQYDPQLKTFTVWGGGQYPKATLEWGLGLWPLEFPGSGFRDLGFGGKRV